MDFGANTGVRVAGALIVGPVVAVFVAFAERVLFAAFVVAFVSFLGEVMHPAVHVDAIIVRAINSMSILLREFIFITPKCEGGTLK